MSFCDLYDFYSTDVSYDSYTDIEREETCYYVPEKNYDTVLLEDEEFHRVQPWVLDDLRARHPDVSEYSVSVRRCEDGDAFWSYAGYEICVVEYFEL